MSRSLDSVRGSLGKLADRLEAIQLALRTLEAAIPETAEETARLEDVETLETATEIRAVIDCVLHDSIGPALRDLRDLLARTKPR